MICSILARKKEQCPLFLSIVSLYVYSIFSDLTVLLREFDGNHLSAKVHTRLFRNERTSGVGVTHELDEGEALDGPVVGTVCVQILGNVGITDGAVFLEERAQLVGRHIARQIASDECLDLIRIEQNSCRDLLNLHGSRTRLDSLERHIEHLDVVIPMDTASILLLVLTGHRLAKLIHHLCALALGHVHLVIQFVLFRHGVGP